MGDPELAADSAGVFDRAERTARIFALDHRTVGTFRPHVERDADHSVPLLYEQRCGDRAVDSSAHSHQNR
jgi:hypothetical protein